MREGPSLAVYPAGSGSGGALFAETPNGLGAEGNSLNLVRSKVTIWFTESSADGAGYCWNVTADRVGQRRVAVVVMGVNPLARKVQHSSSVEQ